MAWFERWSDWTDSLRRTWSALRPEPEDPLLERARDALLAGSPRRALTLAEKRLALRPPQMRAHLYAGLAAAELQEDSSALDHLQALLQSDEADRLLAAERGALYRTLGDIARRTGHPLEALQNYRRALRWVDTDDARWPLLLTLAEAEERLGQSDEALIHRREALRFREDGALRLMVARTLRQRGELDEAMVLLTQGDEAYEPTDRETQRELFLLWLLRDDPAHAGRLQARGEALRAEHALSMDEALLYAVWLRERGHWETASLALAPWLEVATPEPAVLHEAARLRWLTGQPDAARTLLERAAALPHTTPTLLLDLARLTLAQRRAEDARMALEEARRRDAPDAACRLLLDHARWLSPDPAEGASDAGREDAPPQRGRGVTADQLALRARRLLRRDPTEPLRLLRELEATEPAYPGLALLLQEALDALKPTFPLRVPHEDPGALSRWLEQAQLAFEDVHGWPASGPAFAALRERLLRPLTIAVAGEFNAGKSTLLNAILGEEVLAIGVLPTTSHRCVLRHGPRQVARLVNADGAIEEVPYAEAARRVKSAPDSLASVEMWHPHPWLREVWFWDTPGFNAPVSGHEEVARAALLEAEVVLWVMDAHQALSASEAEHLALVEQPRERLLIVVNKAEHLRAEEREAIEDHLRANLPTSGVAGVFFLSARHAWEQRAKQPPAPDAGAGDPAWQRFLDTLHAQVLARSAYLKVKDVHRAALRLLEEGRKLARRERARYDGALASLDAAGAALRDAAPMWEGRQLGAARDQLRAQCAAAQQAWALQVAQRAPKERWFQARTWTSAEQRLWETQIRQAWRKSAGAFVASLWSAAALAVSSLEVTLAEWEDAWGGEEGRRVGERANAWRRECQALRGLLYERSVARGEVWIEARARHEGARAWERFAATLEDEAVHEALACLWPRVEDLDRGGLVEWSERYYAAAQRLCDALRRDVSLWRAALDVQLLTPCEVLLEDAEP